MMQGWQGECADGPKGGWSCTLCYLKWLQRPSQPQLLDIVSVVVVAAAVTVVNVVVLSCSCSCSCC